MRSGQPAGACSRRSASCPERACDPRALGFDPRPDACVLVGDSISDFLAAHDAGIHSIGYANGKRQALADAGAAIVIET